MRNILLLMSIAFVLVGCGVADDYNAEVEKYNDFIAKDVSKKIDSLDDEKSVKLHDEFLLKNAEVKRLEDRITADGKITKDEFKEYKNMLEDIYKFVKNY